MNVGVKIKQELSNMRQESDELVKVYKGYEVKKGILKRKDMQRYIVSKVGIEGYKEIKGLEVEARKQYKEQIRKNVLKGKAVVNSGGYEGKDKYTYIELYMEALKVRAIRSGYIRIQGLMEQIATTVRTGQKSPYTNNDVITLKNALKGIIDKQENLIDFYKGGN